MSSGTGLRGLIVDYGGVLTSDLGAAMAAWCEADDIEPGSFRALMRLWEAPDGPGNPVHDLETGRLPGTSFEAVLAAELHTRSGRPVAAAGLLQRMFAGFEASPTMTAALRTARAAGIRTALLSNSWALDYPRDLWTELFDVVVISGEVGLRKPDPAIYELCLSRLGLAAGECVFVDDLRVNVRAAVDVGMVGVRHLDASTTCTELTALFGLELS